MTCSNCHHGLDIHVILACIPVAAILKGRDDRYGLSTKMVNPIFLHMEKRSASICEHMRCRHSCTAHITLIQFLELFCYLHIDVSVGYNKAAK